LVTYKTLDDIRQAVEQHQGVLTVGMDELRDAKGAGRLGVHVRAGIRKDLAGLGLGHWPRELPESQDELVRIYKQGSPVADLIDAVLEPNLQHDEEIRQAVAKEPAQILRQIRELACK
jgi:hypothetical protein